MRRPAHLPTAADITALPRHGLRLLVSGCLTGRACGYDGSSYGSYPLAQRVLDSPHVRVFPFCPEDFSFGTPRKLPNLHGGDGLALLRGKPGVRVLTEPDEEDWTAGMVRAGRAMLAFAEEQRVDLCLMMDVSAACGSTVIYDGPRLGPSKRHQLGVGVAAAMLVDAGYRIVSQRDFRALGLLVRHLDPTAELDAGALDHHESPWMVERFPE